MEFHCEDLPKNGLVLIPPTSPQYDTLIAGIQHRHDHPVAGSPPRLPMGIDATIVPEDRDASAILLNQSGKPVFALSLIWGYLEVNGRPSSGNHMIGVGGFPSLLLPFGINEKARKLAGYWNVILPGSKRYLSGGKMVGDNSDVRPPAPDEMWLSGIIGGGGLDRRPQREFQSVTLTLDGVFFTDGQFVGPNKGLLWEQVVTEAESTMQVAKIASQGHFEGAPLESIFTRITELTGPAPERQSDHFPGPRGNAEAWKRYALSKLATQVERMRRQKGDEGSIYVLSEWAMTELPKFRKS